MSQSERSALHFSPRGHGILMPTDPWRVCRMFQSFQWACRNPPVLRGYSRSHQFCYAKLPQFQELISFILPYLCTCFHFAWRNYFASACLYLSVQPLKPNSRVPLWRQLWFSLSLHSTNRPGFKSQDLAHLVSSQEVIIVFSNSWSWPGFFSSLW